MSYYSDSSRSNKNKRRDSTGSSSSSKSGSSRSEIDSTTDQLSTNRSSKWSESTLKESNSNRKKSESNFGSGLFLKKPPAPPPRRKSEIENKNTKEEKENENADENFDSSFSETIDLYLSPKSQKYQSTVFDSRVPLEKIESTEKVIEKLLTEYKRNLEDKVKTKDQDVLLDNLLNELVAIKTLILIAYGESNLKYVKSCIKLAECYLDYKNFPQQAKQHCDVAKVALTKYNQENIGEKLDRKTRDELNIYWNYIMGRACSALKKNDEAIKCLDDAANELNEYIGIHENTEMNLKEWQINIYNAQAKQNANMGKHKPAFDIYQKLMDIVDNKDEDSTTKNVELIIKLLIDQAKAQQSLENYETAINLLTDALELAEKDILLSYIGECKFLMAKVHLQFKEMAHNISAEKLLSESIEIYKKEYGDVHDRTLEASQDLANYLIQQERYDDAKESLKKLIRLQRNELGDYHVNVANNLKLLASIYLKTKDMPSAAVFLTKCLEIEELNYGQQNKTYLSTKELLDKLKKNPNVTRKLNIKDPNEQPKFQPANHLSHRAADLKLYQTNEKTPTNLNDSKKVK